MFCTKCGKELAAEAKFCTRCGTRVTPPSQPPAPAPQQPAVPVQPVPPQQPAAPVPPAVPAKPAAPTQPVPPQQPAPKEKKVKKEVPVGRIILVSILLVLIAAAAIAAATMFPLKVDVDAPKETSTKTGLIEKLKIPVEANQPISRILYALEPEDPDNIELYTAADCDGGMLNKTLVLEDLQVPPGTATLYVRVETWFGSHTEEIELTCDIGYTAAPQEDAIVTLEDGTSLVVNELLIYFVSGTPEREAKSLIEEYDGEVVGQVYMMDQYQVRFSTYSIYDLDEIMWQLQEEPSVELVCYNLVFQEELAATPDDSEYDSWDVSKPGGNNWGLECIDAPGAWEYQRKMSTVKVGVIDSSLDYDHPDLQIDPDNTHILATGDFNTLEDLMEYYDDHVDSHRCEDSRSNCVFCSQKNHGTHVAGIIGARANNGEGVAGVNWNTDIYFSTWWYYTIPEEGQLSMYSNYNGWSYNITRMVMSGCRVINVSVGSSSPSSVSSYETSTAEAYDLLVRKLEESGYDFLITKAAGNKNDNAGDYQLNRIMTTGDYAKAHTIIVANVTYSKGWFSGKIQYSLSDSSNYGALIDVAAPGTGIYNTYYGGGYDYMGGTSMAAPAVAGVASMLYALEPGLTYDEVKDIVCSQVDKYTSKGGRTYPIVNARLAVEYVAENGGGNPQVQLPVAGYITGLIQDAATEQIISSAGVLVTNVQTQETIVADVFEGTYYVYLEPGTYDLTFSADGYISETIYNVEVVEGVVTYNILLNMVEDEEENGTIVGSILDAFDASSIPNAAINIYSGINSTEGAPVLTTTSDSYGSYRASLKPGNYTLVVSASGYTSGTANVIVLPGQTRYYQNCTLSPVLGDGEFRVVLTWGQFPSDLDSHLVGPTPEGGTFHVFYPSSSRNSYYNGSVYVNLDVDDTSSYGPETTSVYVGVDGTYTFYVHNYSDRNDAFSNGISTSGAQVKVYIGGRSTPYIFNAPTEDGTLWTVFTIENGVLTPVNEMGYESTPSEIGY